jgi:glycosyltransferase involved in cell wall biosynthesis
VDTIPCGIPLPAWDVPDEAPDHDLHLAWVGRINERQKRVSDLCAIAQALRDEGRSFRLDIIGDGEDAAALRAAFERAELTNHVFFRGWLPSVAVLATLRRADVLLLPSNYEGMPVAAMEALASGCAVVGSDTCGLEEYADCAVAREALWIYPRGKIADALNAIHEASEVPRDRRRVAARRLAEVEFAIAVCMDRYAALCERIASREGNGGAIAALHPGDVTSWIRSRARLLRAYARALLPGRHSTGGKGSVAA